MKSLKHFTWLLALTLLTANCSDNDATAEPDPPAEPPPEYAVPTAFPVALSATGPDQLQAAVAGPDATFFAAGFRATTLTGDKEVVVVKFTSTGVDTTWGGGTGVVATGLVFKGGGDEIEIARQTSGKILVAAVVANGAQPLDTDIAVARLNADGAIDPSFGTNGVRTLDLSTALIVDTTVTGGDRVRALATDASDRIYLHGVQRGVGDFNGTPRTDTDFVVVRLGIDGADDTTFGTGGKYLLDIPGSAPSNTPSNATARGIKVLADGSIIAGGYATVDGFGPNPQPVVYKLDGNGAPVTGFATNGLFHDTVLSTQTEVYGFFVRDNQIITGGYGRETGTANDWVSLRFDAITGVRDLTWGTANGVMVADVSGTGATDACRTAIALPEGKTLLLGSTGPSNDPAQDAAFAVLNAAGTFDTPRYGKGIYTLAFGATPGADQFWGGAVSGRFALLVGHRGAGTAQTESNNDESYALILPVQFEPK